MEDCGFNIGEMEHRFQNFAFGNNFGLAKKRKGMPPSLFIRWARRLIAQPGDSLRFEARTEHTAV